jgi:hypothetical protein
MVQHQHRAARRDPQRAVWPERHDQRMVDDGKADRGGLAGPVISRSVAASEGRPAEAASRSVREYPAVLVLGQSELALPQILERSLTQNM